MTNGSDHPDLDPERFTTQVASVRGDRIAYVRAGQGGVPLLCVHGWPETKRIWWRVIDPLAAAGFDVIVPDLRGFGESGPGADGHGDPPAHARDLAALCAALGVGGVVAAGGDLGGPVVQELTGRAGDLVERLVLFNSPLPYDRDAMAGLRTRSSRAVTDYFRRQGHDPDGLLADLSTADQRRRYIATFYTSRFWAHPDTFDDEAAAFHAEPFGDEGSFRASIRAYEAAFHETARSEPAALPMPNPVPTLLLFGPSDHVIYPDFDRMAEVVFPNRVGPFLLRDCGHFVPWERPAAFVGAVRAFCADRLGRAPT